MNTKSPLAEIFAEIAIKLIEFLLLKVASSQTSGGGFFGEYLMVYPRDEIGAAQRVRPSFPLLLAGQKVEKHNKYPWLWMV